MLRFILITLFLLMVSMRAQAQFSAVACPARILAVEPKAQCVAKNSFSYLIFGTRKVATPSAGCKEVENHVLGTANVQVSCQFVASASHCSCQSNGAQHRIDLVKIDNSSLNPACPPEHDILDERTLLTDAAGIAVPVQICKPKATCPVEPIKPITDPITQEHETGQYSRRPDMDNVLEPTRTGANCLINANKGSRITSGNRPQPYQDHMREVWDKWAILQKDSTTACADIRSSVLKEF